MRGNPFCAATLFQSATMRDRWRPWFRPTKPSRPRQMDDALILDSASEIEVHDQFTADQRHDL